jgi:K+-sensing histidine kinase KdpD
MRTAPIALSLGIVLVVTIILFYVKDSQQGAQHLVFFYLLPNTFVAIAFGSVLSMLCAIVATLLAAFFLYDPIYSLYVSDPRGVGELILFAGLGLLGAKCISFRKMPPTGGLNSLRAFSTHRIVGAVRSLAGGYRPGSSSK